MDSFAPIEETSAENFLGTQPTSQETKSETEVFEGGQGERSIKFVNYNEEE